MNLSPEKSDLPLDGVTVLDFSQYLAGPSCALRLADLGASVFKVERPAGGDQCRSLAVADQWVGEDSLLFHTINRNKGSIAADLKDPADLEAIKRLIKQADVVLHNFRPGVMERIGLGYDDVSAINPRIIYGVVSGYGKDGPWRDKPGQDLLAQSRSGLAWLTGSAGDGPVPMGVSITDIAAGQHLAQGILAALYRQAREGRGSLVEVSLLASAMDLQFEQYTSFLNSDRSQPRRSAVNGANIHATAPYGIYETADGYMALAMCPVSLLRKLLTLDALQSYSDDDAYKQRDEIKQILKDHLQTRPTEHWLAILEPAGVWCSEILDWPALQASGALDSLDVVQSIDGSTPIDTTTCPIRLDGRALPLSRGAPALGQDSHLLKALGEENNDEKTRIKA